ncbi:MAG: hypothetical protein R8K20_01400 [Gallionellaceae bacterium]
MELKLIEEKKGSNPKVITEPPAFKNGSSFLEQTDDEFLHSRKYKVEGHEGSIEVIWSRHWKIIESSEVPSGVPLDYKIRIMVGMVKTDASKLGASLGVDAGGLNGALSAEFNTSVTISDEQVREIHYAVPAQGHSYKWVCWQLINKFRSVGAVHTINNALRILGGVTSLGLSEAVIGQIKWDETTLEMSNHTRPQADPEVAGVVVK